MRRKGIERTALFQRRIDGPSPFGCAGPASLHLSARMPQRIGEFAKARGWYLFETLADDLRQTSRCAAGSYGDNYRITIHDGGQSKIALIGPINRVDQYEIGRASWRERGVTYV